MRVLITRPLDAARDTVAELKLRGHDAIVEPLLAIVIEHGPPVDAARYARLVLTSANGARAAATRMADREIPVLTVGPATAAQARALGFTQVTEADGNGIGGIVSALARLPARGDRPLLHVAGTDVAGDLAAEARKLGLTLERMTLYRAVAADTLSDSTREALKAGHIDAAMFFSPRTAEIFARLAQEAGIGQHLGHVCACVISQNAANALKSLTFGKVLVAQQTTVGAMVDLLDDL